MALQKLKALTAFLIAHNLTDENQLDSWMEDGRLMPASQHTGTGFVICRFEYDAIFSLERYSGAPDLLFALVCVWLMDVDESREDNNLPPPDITVDILDAKTADVEIKITFREDITLVQDDTGRIPFNGDTWSLGEPELNIADEISIGTDTEIMTDKSYLFGDPQ